MNYHAAKQGILHCFPALKVVIDVRYTPLEPGYQPPNYRAASPVTLTCRAVGATGRIRYCWTSTCRASCFVPYSGNYEYSYGGVARSRDFLRYYDAGTHYCSAYDSSQGISGSASTVMNVVGEICLMYTTVNYPYYNGILNYSPLWILQVLEYM